MSSDQSLAVAIIAHLSGFLEDSLIDKEANEGAHALLMKQAERALLGFHDQKVLDLWVETARVTLQTGISRGRFELAKEIVDLVTKWQKSRGE